MSAEPGLVQCLRLQPWTVQAQGNWVCEQCVHFGVRTEVGRNPSSSGWRTKANHFQSLTFDLLIYWKGSLWLGLQCRTEVKLDKWLEHLAVCPPHVSCSGDLSFDFS